MKPHSLARQMVALVLLVETLAALSMTGFVFLYERHTHFHSLDVALRGYADSLMGAVVDANDVDDRVVLDLQGVPISSQDVYEVWDEHPGGLRDLLGRSPGWTAPAGLHDGTAAEASSLVLHGVSYRMVRVEGVRTVDPEASNVVHRVVVIYGSPTEGAWRPVIQAVRAFSLACLVLLAMSWLLVTLLVRSSLHPLASLASSAAEITSGTWRFSPPLEARTTRELAPLVVALEDLLGRLRLSFEQQRQFVSDSGHELKTAVTVVKSSLQLLEMRDRSPREYRAGVLSSLHDCQRMEELVYRMLTLARLEEGGSALAAEAAPVDSDLVGGACASIASLASVAQLHEVSLDYDGPSSASQLHGAIAREDWQTLCTNLLLNAIQHSERGKRVRLRLIKEADSVCCQVIDQGEGMAAEVVPHIFGRFYRGDASRARSTGGSGLGLAICKAIVERARGSIAASSEAGLGTTITMRLPLVPGSESRISEAMTARA